MATSPADRLSAWTIGERHHLERRAATSRTPPRVIPDWGSWVLAVIATRTDWVLSVTEYSIFIRPDLLQQFWQVMSDGGFITEAVAVIDTSRRTGRRVLVEAGGVRLAELDA